MNVREAIQVLEGLDPDKELLIKRGDGVYSTPNTFSNLVVIDPNESEIQLPEGQTLPAHIMSILIS